MTISTHTYTVELIGTPDVPLSLKGGTITLDASRAPHVRADLVIAPVSEAVSDALDPRESPRVRITAVNGSVTRVFDLGVRSRPIRYSSVSYGLALSSDEGVMEDQGPLSDLDYTFLAPSGRDVVNAILDQVTPGTALEVGPDFTITGAASDALIWRAGESAMEFLAPLVQAYGFRLVCDEQRKWTLRNENYTVPGGISIRYGVNMIDASETISRDANLWFDAAVTRYRWIDPAGVRHEEYDSYAHVPLYTKMVRFDREVAFPGPGFSQYATRRAQGRGREVSATAVADWRAASEQGVEIVLPDSPRQTGLSQSVTFDLDTDRMTITTRTVDTSEYSYLIGPTGASYADVPVGVDYESFDWSVV